VASAADFWSFLPIALPGQFLSLGGAQAKRGSATVRPVPANTSAYCRRGRDCLELLQQLIQRWAIACSSAGRSGTLVRTSSQGARRHHLSAEDTPANQKVFAQPRAEQGLRFSAGAAGGFVQSGQWRVARFARNYLQSELALAAQLWTLLEPGDAVGRSLFWLLSRAALVLGCQADAVCRLHASRQATFATAKGAAHWTASGLEAAQASAAV